MHRDAGYRDSRLALGINNPTLKKEPRDPLRAYQCLSVPGWCTVVATVLSLCADYFSRDSQLVLLVHFVDKELTRMINRGKCLAVQCFDYPCVAAAPVGQAHLWHGGARPCVPRSTIVHR